MLNYYARSLLAGGAPSNELRTSARELLVLGITKMDEGLPQGASWTRNEQVRIRNEFATMLTKLEKG
eukprot:9364028-Pyramimonas_sp.AAC.1